jgi:multiple sugar transport system permease protein
MATDLTELNTARVRSRHARNLKEYITGWSFIAAPMSLFAVLSLGILLYAVYISRYDWGLLGARQYLGWGNFTHSIHDPVFLRAIRNSLLYAALVVPLQSALGLVLALLVNSKIKGSNFFRATFYFPSMASSAAITTLFILLMTPAGLFNKILHFFGVNISNLFNQGQWLSDSRTALYSVIVLNAWTTSGTMMLFYLANLQGIDGSYEEVAKTDGANRWQILRYITMPLLKPAHFFVITTGMIGALQLYDQAILAGGADGSPNYSLMTMVLYIYNACFRQFKFGYGAAIGLELFVIIFSLTLAQRFLFGSRAWKGDN